MASTPSWSARTAVIAWRQLARTEGVLLALFATLVPRDYLKTLPHVQYLGSSIAVGAVGAVLLHQILPERREG